MADPKLKLEKILESTNVAEDLDKDYLTRLGSRLYQEIETDLRSRSAWDAQYERWMKLAMQTEEVKSFPWPNAANVKYPLITIAALQFGARAYPALVPPGNNLVKGLVHGFDHDGQKSNAASRVGKHMSYQLMEEMPDWEEDMDKLTTILPIVGCMFKKTYYDPIEGTNISTLVGARNLIINYWAKNLETAFRKTEVTFISDNDVHSNVVTEIWRDLDYTKELPDSPQTPGVTGTSPPMELDGATPNCFFEIHTYLDLDGDGYQEPYIITMHKASLQIARIVARFDASSISQMEDGKIVKITADEYYTKYGFIPNPDGGFYDVGFGLLLGHINKSINTLMNLLLDSGTLSNLPAGFIAKGIRISGGDKPLRPGEWRSVQTRGEDLRNGIVPLPVGQPSNVLFQLLGMLMDGGQRVGSIQDVLMGENPGQNQPASTTMAVIEQGMKVFSAIHKRLYRAMHQEFKKLHKLNRLYLPPESYFMVLDMDEQTAAQINRTDYERDFTDCAPYADPHVSSIQERMLKVQILEPLVQQGLLNAQEYARRTVEALEIPNPEPLLQLPEPQPNPEFQLEQAKVQDESQRDWKRIEIEEYKTYGQVKVQGDKVTLAANKAVHDANDKEGKRNLAEVQAVHEMGHKDTALSLESAKAAHAARLEESDRASAMEADEEGEAEDESS